MTVHTLRKGFGCAYAATQPAQVVQKLMRHANIKTTLEYYANVDAAEAAVLNHPGLSVLSGGGRNASRNTPSETALTSPADPAAN